MRARFWLVACLGLGAAALLGVALGAVRFSPGAIWAALLGHGDSTIITIVRSIRLPRVALAGLVGAALGMSGAAMQGTLRNGLAEPYLLGVSGGAAVGAVAAIAFGLNAIVGVPLAAFAGAAGAAALVLTIARIAGGRADVRLLLMAGVVVGAFANAVIMVAYATAPPETVRGALWWMMGSVDGAEWRRVAVAGGLRGDRGWVAGRLGARSDALALGDDGAAALGVDVERASRRAYLAAGTPRGRHGRRGGAGGIRRARGPPYGAGSRAPAVSRVAVWRRGGWRRVGTRRDVLARTVRPPAELPLGAVTALLGVPFFLFQLRRLAVTVDRTAAEPTAGSDVPECAGPISGRDSGSCGRRDFAAQTWHRHGRDGSQWQRQEYARQGAPAPRADRSGAALLIGGVALGPDLAARCRAPRRGRPTARGPGLPDDGSGVHCTGRFPHASVWRTTDPGGDRAVTAAIERAGVGGLSSGTPMPCRGGMATRPDRAGVGAGRPAPGAGRADDVPRHGPRDGGVRAAGRAGP